MKQQTYHVPDVRKKVTAVNWLIDQIKNQQNQKEFTPEQWLEVIERAKAMEKEQILEAAERWKGTDFAEKYYNETYNK